MNKLLNQLSWKVGGQQGEGIERTGEIFSIALHRMGYFVYGYREFSSRIRGGNTSSKIRVSTYEIQAVSNYIDLLIAFDQQTIDTNVNEVTDKGLVLLEEGLVKPEELKNGLIVPFSRLARELGAPMTKNMVALGASCQLLNLPKELFIQLIAETFSHKDQSVIDLNITAFSKGAEYIENTINCNQFDFMLDKPDGKKRMFMLGNEAVALGAIAAGCKLMPAYPITPATEIMEYLMKKLPELGGTVIQTEDEISAITMAIGGNYAGVRSFTASSGPGLSLMTEAIGLSGMIESPLVLVNVQRGGPSTGLPTKFEQSDLLSMIYNTHGEIPKVVIAPSSVEESFYDMVEAFNIAEELQLPVIVLTDMQLGQGKQTVEPFDYSRIHIRRGKLVTTKEEMAEPYKRYGLSGDGVSRRAIPGNPYGIHHETGVEHDEFGRPCESQTNRVEQMEKRFEKLHHVSLTNPVHYTKNHEKADTLLIGYNSTRGAILEAMAELEEQGVKVNSLHIRLVHPLPVEMIQKAINEASTVIVIENNATAQLLQLLSMKLDVSNSFESITKFDGSPFVAAEIVQKVRRMVSMA